MPDRVPEKDEDSSNSPDASARTIRVGCSDLPPGLARKQYFARLDYLENEGTRHKLPGQRVLRRWLAEAGPGGRFGLLAPQVITDKPGRSGYARGDALTGEELKQAGGFQPSELVKQAVHSIAEACTTLQAETVVFRTPADFSPSATNRRAMRVFFSEIATQERFPQTARVWEPQGLWEIDVAARMACDLGLVLACDPLTNDPLAPGADIFAGLPGDKVYFRITGLGRGKMRFDEYAIESLLDLADAYEHTWLVFAHIHKYPDAIRCRQLLGA